MMVKNGPASAPQMRDNLVFPSELAELDMMQRLRWLTPGGKHGWNQCGEGSDHKNDRGTHKQSTDTQRWIHLSADQSHVIRDPRKLAVIHAHLHQTEIGDQPHDYPGDHANKTDQRAFQDKRHGDLARLESHGAKQTDLACSFIDGHHEQVQNADPCDHDNDDTENIHHYIFATYGVAELRVIVCP